MSATPGNSSGATIVTQTRVAPDKAEAFARWQDEIAHVVATQPG